MIDGMTPRIRAQRDQPILFAHRGASADAPENTLEAFGLALEMGADGLESDVWVSADGEPILVHDEQFGRRTRRRKIGDVARADLPPHMPTITDLFDSVGRDFELSLDIKDPIAVEPALDALRRFDMIDRTWLCHPDVDLLARWRSRWSDLRLVHSTRLARLPHSPERHAATLYQHAIDAVNLRQSDWSGGLTALYHRFDRYCFGWDAQLERTATELLDMGIDAIYGNHVDRLTAARTHIYSH